MSSESSRRGRFAPSPTGLLHLGSARTALAAWLAARSADAPFVLRIEDLDRARSRPEHVRAVLRDLAWLGLDWDEGPDVGGPRGPYVQSERMPGYHAAMERLASRGCLFACRCTRRDVRESVSAPHGPDGPVYGGRCRPDVVTTWRGAPPAGTSVRLRVDAEPVTFLDAVYGPVSQVLSEHVGDYVVWRSDGVPAYQLAVVVDDAAQRIGEVWRGADLLDSTPRQVALHRALGHTPPSFGHVPLVLGPDGERLAKRHGAVSLEELRAAGTDPAALVGGLAASLGLVAPSTRARPAELARAWDPSRLRREPSYLPDPPFPWGPAGPCPP